MEEDRIQEILHRTNCLLEETIIRLDGIERRLNEQQKDLVLKELGRIEDVVELLGCSRSTIDRRCKEAWQEGIHWWQNGGMKIYNLVLIKDWVVNQYDSVAHQRAVEQWAKSLPSNQGKRKKA